MPAYRSSAEAEVREAVVARLRLLRPNARIIHEVNASQFGNRIDVLAVDRAEIIAVEIKSAKDKLDRLPDQIKAMKGVAHHVIAAIHEKFLVPTKTNKWNADFECDGEHWFNALPEPLTSYANPVAWVYPDTKRACLAGWPEPRQTVQKPLPATALDMLWSAELKALCARSGVSASSRATMDYMANALRWQLSGRDLTLGICAALRERRCIEADPEVEWREAA